MNNKETWSRRIFIKSVAGAGTALVLSPLMLSCGIRRNKTGLLTKVLSKTIGVDSHNHIDIPFDAGEIANLKIDLYEALKKSGLSAICITFAVDRPELKKEGEAYQRFLMALDAMDAILKSNSINRALNLSDLMQAHQSNHPIIIQSVEGGHF